MAYYELCLFFVTFTTLCDVVKKNRNFRICMKSRFINILMVI